MAMTPDDFETPLYADDEDQILRRTAEEAAVSDAEELVAELDRYTNGYRIIRMNDGNYGVYQVVLDGDRVLVESAQPVDMTALSLTGLAHLIKDCQSASLYFPLTEDGEVIPTSVILQDEKAHGGG